MEKWLEQITKDIKSLRRGFKYVEAMERFEEYANGGEDKMAGRNRLRLSYGSE